MTEVLAVGLRVNSLQALNMEPWKVDYIQYGLLIFKVIESFIN